MNSDIGFTDVFLVALLLIVIPVKPALVATAFVMALLVIGVWLFADFVIFTFNNRSKGNDK